MIGYLSFYTEPDEDTILLDCREEGLSLQTWKVTPPKPRTKMVTVPGRNGSIDYSDFFGTQVMDRAKIVMTLALQDTAELISVNRSLLAAIHGKSVYFRSSMNQSGRYYKARCSVSTWQRKGSVVYYTVTADCEPFMYGSQQSGTFTTTEVPELGKNAVNIPSPGDYKSSCSASVPQNGSIVICDGNRNMLEYLFNGMTRKVSTLQAGTTNYYYNSTVGTVVSYSFYPLYYFECGV